MITRHELPDQPYDIALQVWVDEDDDVLDYTFYVSACREDDAHAALSAAYDHWFDTDPDLTLFEELERALIESGIPFEVKGE